MKDERNIIHPIVSPRTLQDQLGLHQKARKDDSKVTLDMKSRKQRQIGQIQKANYIQ